MTSTINPEMLKHLKTNSGREKESGAGHKVLPHGIISTMSVGLPSLLKLRVLIDSLQRPPRHWAATQLLDSNRRTTADTVSGNSVPILLFDECSSASDCGVLDIPGVPDTPKDPPSGVPVNTEPTSSQVDSSDT
jgi:hypothetical protein